MAAQPWTPHSSLTTAPTNLKEAIDWVLRVTGKDGRKNEKPAAAVPPQKDSGPHCLCYLAKAIKDLLYDAKDPGSPGPSTHRNWDDLLLEQEKYIAQPVLQDLGLVHSGSTSAASSTCAGGTEVIGTLIDQLALGLQKWVGWKETGDECCLKGGSGGQSTGIGGKCECSSIGGGGNNCCSGSKPCHECEKCAPKATSGPDTKCYLSAYCKKNSTSGGSGNTEGDSYWPSISSDSTKVHLLARIFLGSVCLIWSGLSQLGFLTGKGTGGNRWETSKLHDIKDAANAGLGSFMAAMGYDLDRLNQGSGGQKGEFVHTLLTGNGGKGIQWKEFTGNSANQNSVAEYYSTIYDKAKEALKKDNKTESICNDYPLLVLHILASGYFRAGSAGANKITPAPKAPSSDPRKPRNPRTIREILYWLSALPYSQGYCQLVERMGQKYPPKEGSPNESVEQIVLHGESLDKKTDLKRDCITHYLLAACGYCPLVLIGIQGTIEREVDNAGTQASGSSAGGSGGSSPSEKNRCPEHKKDPSAKRCTLEEAAAQASASAGSANGELQAGQVCYGGYHLEVSSFGPLHGMYANGLFGFQMDMSSAQCLDQLRIYVYHCFYQLYFLRKQCSAEAVLGWNSCRYGSGVNPNAGVSNGNLWRCEAQGSGQDCQCKKTAGHQSPLMYFLCDGIGLMVCEKTKGVGLNSQKQKYPEIDAHMNKTVDSNGKEQPAHKNYPELCPVPMGWSMESKDGHFKDLNYTHKTKELTAGSGTATTYPVHCTGNTLSLLLEYYCDPLHCHGTLVVLLRLLACITPTVPRTLGDLFGFYYYIVNMADKSKGFIEGICRKDEPGAGAYAVINAITASVKDSIMGLGYEYSLKHALSNWGGNGGSNSGAGCSHKPEGGSLKTLYGCKDGNNQCCPYLSPLSGQQYGQLSPAMAGTYLSWLVYLIGEFKDGLEGLEEAFREINCRGDCKSLGGVGCNSGKCTSGTHGGDGICCCESVVSCTGVLPVLYKYGFGYGDVSKLHKDTGADSNKKCHNFLGTLKGVLESEEFQKLTNSINQLIYTTRLPWIFVLTLAWLVAVLYLAFGAIWPLDWTHMRSHCRGWFRKGSLSPWEVLMVGKKKGRGILEFFGGR